MKRRTVAVLVGCFLFFSCQTEGESVSVLHDELVFDLTAEETPSSPSPSPSPVPAPVEPELALVEEEPFNPQQVSQELFDTTLGEVQRFITRLNDIIHAKKYDAWVKSLSQEYIETYSSPNYLKRASEDPLFKSKKIVLTNFRDFFMYNVVPSRENIDTVEVDDIEFITPTRVKAFTVNAKGQRLRLYELEKDGNDWKIIN
jgi:hypothetical protein